MLWLKILGIVLLCLLLLLLFIRIGVDFCGNHEGCEVRIVIGALRIPIYPLPENSQKESETYTAKSPSPKKEKPHRKSRRKPHFETVDWGGVVDLALTLLGELKDALHIRTLRVNLIIATQDAAKTALLLGGASAAAGMLVPFLDENFSVTELHVVLDADFEQAKTKWAVVAVLAVRPISVLWVLLRNAKQLYALYQQIMKKDEAEKT